MGIDENDYQARRYETLQSGMSLADCYEQAAQWCEKPGSNLDMFTALDVVGWPIWDGLAHVQRLQDLLLTAQSKYLLSKSERATLLCMAATIERAGW